MGRNYDLFTGKIDWSRCINLYESEVYGYSFVQDMIDEAEAAKANSTEVDVPEEVDDDFTCVSYYSDWEVRTQCKVTQ